MNRTAIIVSLSLAFFLNGCIAPPSADFKFKRSNFKMEVDGSDNNIRIYIHERPPAEPEPATENPDGQPETINQKSNK